jgi:hypothetical protein
MERVRLCVEKRCFEKLYHRSDQDIWVLRWLPGQSTGFHDHGASLGALVVTAGVLEERRPGELPQVIRPGHTHTFGSNYAHDVRNVSAAPAITIHAYSPPLREMNEYELDGSRLNPRVGASRKAGSINEEQPASDWTLVDRSSALSIDQVLSAPRERLRRLNPDQALRPRPTLRQCSSIFAPTLSARSRAHCRRADCGAKRTRVAIRPGLQCSIAHRNRA